MESNSTLGQNVVLQEQNEESSFDFKTLYLIFLLNWKWFVLSLIICLGAAAIHLRYATPIYQASEKVLIKNEEQNSGYRRNSIATSANLGLVSNSEGFDNEVEILKSLSIARQTVRDLKLYVTYKRKGRIKDHLIYQTQPINVDMDFRHLEELAAPVSLEIERNGQEYHVTGSYQTVDKETGRGTRYDIDRTITQMPIALSTRVGLITFNINSYVPMNEGEILKVVIRSPQSAAYKYVGSLGVTQTSKTTSIAQLVLNDEIPQRAIDYLNQLVVCYNRQANDDKNEVARKTEAFINSRLEKINAELGDTEGQLESYKKRNRIVGLEANSTAALANQDSYNQKLNEVDTQIELLRSLIEYINQPSNKYQAIPSSVGLNDASATSQIAKYNEAVMERNRLLRSASESSPTVIPVTAQIEDMANNIRRAMNQALRNYQIQRNSVANQFNKYVGEVSSNPEQERMLTQIGRQQDVKSGLYLMLLQKREENSISLAATADKGKPIDEAQFSGRIAPKSNMIYLIAFAIGLFLPAIIIFLGRFFRYKIEGHDDVAAITKLPIVADVAVANETAKTKADIVVHENENNQMEEIFRSLRTNLQFMLKDNQNSILFTSSTSGEGKTFIAANLAVSFALLDKKVVLVGLDIRKPRLAELFEIDDNRHGITNLLVRTNPSWTDIKGQMIPSGINDNLDILPAGPIPPNPTELVSREALDQIITQLKANYDYVIIDTAPVGLVSDTLQIGRTSDLTVYVCRADYTPKASFSMINSLSEENKLPNMCVVINGIDMSKKKYGYYYGYRSYRGYGSRYAGHSYGGYGYGNYSASHYGNADDESVKK